MFNHKMSVLFFFITIALMGCQDEHHSNYLLTHPAYLQKEVVRCRSLETKNTETETYCQQVEEILSIVSRLVQERLLAPEEFGQRIIDIEIEFAKEKKDLKETKQAFSSLKSKESSASALQIAQDKINKSHEQYQQTKREMEMMLAIVGLNSP